MRLLWLLAGLLLLAAPAHAAVNTFANDVQMCSGRPWIDVTCNGADPTGVVDSTTAINTTTAAAISNDWPIFFPAGTYKVTSKLTVEFGGQANNGPQIISQGATLDGSTIASGNVLQVQCNGGSTASPVVCNHFGIQGWLTVKGSGAGYTVVLGKTDFSDQQNGVRIEHLVATNAGTGGAIQANYLTDGDLWLSGTTQGGSSSVGAVALEQVQTSKVGGYGLALGASAPGLLIENGSSIGNQFLGFAYDPNDAVCISITSAAAMRNAWLAPYLPCTTAINAPTSANRNALIGPHITAANMGPTSTGISIIGRGSVHKYSAPAASSQTLAGTDDGTIFSSANATGAGTGFAGSTLTLTLPDPAQVGPGWTTAYVSDLGKAVVLQTAGSAKILARGQQLTSLTVGAPNQKSLDFAIIESDGSTGFRLVTISQAAGLLNGLETGFPATWMFLPGPGYTASLTDNGEVLSSGQTSSGLALTLPQTTTLPVGWSLGLSQDSSKSISVQVNGTNGGQIMRASAPVGQSSLATLADHQVITLYYDGTNFREISPPPSKRVDATSFGAQCGASVDATNALQLADNYYTAGGGGGTITVSCPLKIAGTFFLDDYVHLQGEGAVYYRGMLDRAPNGGAQAATWPPLAGPAIDCSGTVAQGINDCILIRGIGWEIDHINFGNTQPTPPGSGFSWTPTNFGWIIGTSPAANANGGHLHHLSFTAGTRCVDIEGTPNYTTAGIAGAQGTISDIWFNGCFNTVMRMSRLDNTWRVSNIDEDFWWHRDNIAVAYYAENNKIGLDLCFVANTQFDNIEWFWDKSAIQLSNCTVSYTTDNSFVKTFAAANLQFNNVDFNLACQAVSVPNGNSTIIDTMIFTNVIAAQDNSWCGNSQTFQHPNPTGAAFFDFSCDGCNEKLIGMRVQDVDSLAAAGNSGNMFIAGVNIDSYSAFRTGQPALKIPASAHVTAACMNDFSAWGAGAGAGPLAGPGLDDSGNSSKGFLQPCYVGGAGAKPGGGSVLLQQTGDTRSGYTEYYYDPGAPAPAGGGGGGAPTNRLGYSGACVVALGCNVAADHGPMFIRPHAADFGGNSPALKVDSTSGTLHLNVSGLDATTPPSGAPLGTMCIDSQGNLYFKFPTC